MEPVYVNPEDYIPQLLSKWDELHEAIKTLFEKRDNRTTRAPMEQGIRYLMEFIFLSNGFSVSPDKEVDMQSLTFKPVNIEERLQFLKMRPTLYPSFIQLTELFEEQKKLYAKQQAVRKRQKHL